MNVEGVKQPHSEPCSNQMSGEGQGENEAETLTANSVKCPSGICFIKDGGNFTNDELSNSSKVDMSPSKIYRIPKLLRNHSDVLSEVTLSSYEFQHEVLPKVTQHFYYNSSVRFSIKKCCLVNNSELVTKFVEKKKAMKNDGYTEKELSEMFGFICAVGPRKEDFISDVIKHGIKVGNKESSLIGHPQMGVLLSRYSDVIPVATTDSSQIIMFKFLKGRVKSVPLNSTGGRHSDPTPNYDCHVNKPVAIETKNMTDQQILDQNQIYLYEYNEEGRIVEYPRQIVPYAVLDVIYKPIHSNNTLNSPLGKKFSHRSPLTGSCKRTSAKEEYIVWNGKLSLKGSYACNVTMMSSAGYFKPVRLGSNINICNRSEIVRAEEKYFNKLDELNKYQETFWRRRYINITELKPKPGSVDHFQKIAKYLLEKNCLAIVKPDSNTVLFLIPSCSLTARLGLSGTEYDKYGMLYCLFLSKQSAYLNSPQYTYCMFKTTGKVQGVENYFSSQQQTITDKHSMDKCDPNFFQIYPSGIGTPVKNNLGSMNWKNQNENNTTFSSPQINIHAPFSPRFSPRVNSPLQKTPPIKVSPYSRSPVCSPWHRSKAFDDFTKPISKAEKLKFDKVIHTFDCQYSLELYEMAKSEDVSKLNPCVYNENDRSIPEISDHGNQNATEKPNLSYKTKLKFEESKPDISKMKLNSCDNNAYIPNSGDPCFYEHLSPEVASAKLNFLKIYSGISSEDNSTDLESIGTDLDSPRLDPAVSGISTFNDMKNFLNKSVNREQNKYIRDNVSKKEEVPLVVNIDTGEVCPVNNPPLVASKNHAISQSTSSYTVEVTKSDIYADMHVNRDGYEDQKQRKETVKGRKVDNCSSGIVANFDKQFEEQEVNPKLMEATSEDDCLFEIANQVSERCSQSDSSDEDEGYNAYQIAYKTVMKLSKTNSNCFALPTYINNVDSTRPSIRQSSTDSADGTCVETDHSSYTVNDLIPVHTEEIGKLRMKQPLHECSNLYQDSQNSDCCHKESPEDAEVRLCMADIQNQIEISLQTKLRITPEMPTLSIAPLSITNENVICSIPVLEKSNEIKPVGTTQPDSDTNNTPNVVDNQRASPDIDFFSSLDILKVCKNASQGGPIIHKTDSTSGAGLNSCNNFAKPLKISIPEEGLAFPDKVIPRYSSDEDSFFDTSSNRGAPELTSDNCPPSKSSEFVLDILDSTSTGFFEEDFNPPSDSVASFTLEEDFTSDQESILDKCNSQEIKGSTFAEASQQNKKKVDFPNSNAAQKKTVLNPYVPLSKVKVKIAKDQRIIVIGPSSNNENTKVKNDIITEANSQLCGIESDIENGESSALSDFQNFMDNSDYQVVDEVYCSDDTEIYDHGKSESAEICENQIRTDQKTDMPVFLAEQARTTKDRNMYSFINKSLNETRHDEQLSQPVVNLTRCDSPNSPFNIKKLFPSKFSDIKPFNELFSESIRKIKMAKSSNKLKLSKTFDNDDHKFLSKLETVCGDDSDSSFSSSNSYKTASIRSKSPHRSKHSHSRSKAKDKESVYDTVSSHTDLSKHDRKHSKDVKHKTDKHSPGKSSSEQTALGKHHYKKSKKHSKTKSDTVLEKTSRDTSPHKSRHKKSKSSTVKQLESIDEDVKSKRDSHRRSRSDDVVTSKSDDRKSKHSKKPTKSKRSVQLMTSPSKSLNVLSVKDHKTIKEVKGTSIVTNFTIPKKKSTKSKEDKSKPHITSSVEKVSIEKIQLAKAKLPKDAIPKTKLLTSALKQAGLELKKPFIKKVEAKKMSKVENVNDIGKKVEQNLAEQLKGSDSIVEKFLLISATDFPDVKGRTNQATALSSKSSQAKADKKTRKFHPYAAPQGVSKKKQWASFDLPVSDLKALMQDLTTYSYRSYNQPINHGATKGKRYNSRHERRFSNYVFQRSEVPADDEEVDVDFDADDFVDYEERKKQAELVEQPLDEGDKRRHHKDDFMFEEELRLYSGHCEEGEDYTRLYQSAITDKILKEENIANIEIMASPTNSVESLPKYAGVEIDGEEATDSLMDLESDDELVTPYEIGAAIAVAIPGMDVISATSEENVSSEESLKLNTGNNVGGMKPNIPLNLTLEKSNINLQNKTSSEHSELNAHKTENISVNHLSPNKFNPNTLEESVVLSKVLKNAEPHCTDHASNKEHQLIFTSTDGVPVLEYSKITGFKTDTSTLKSSPVMPNKKKVSVTFNTKRNYSAKVSEAENAKKISVQIGHAIETIPHIPSEILPKPTSVIHPNLIQVPMCTDISPPPVTINDKQEIDDVINKTSDFCLDQNFPKSATFFKVDQDLLSKVSKTIFHSDSSADENDKEKETSKVHAKSSAMLVTETSAKINRQTYQDIKDLTIHTPIHIPVLEKKKSPDLSIRTEVIDDLESMRNLLNCDLEPSLLKGYPKDFQIQTISYDSGITPKPVALHKKVDQILPQPMFSAISHDIVIKPISNNLKTNQFQSALSSRNTGLLCFSKPSTFQFGSKETNIAIPDLSNQIAVQRDGNISSDSSTPVKDEMLTSCLEFDTPLKDEVPRINKTTKSIIVTEPKIVTQLPSGFKNNESEISKSDLKIIPCLDPNSIESQTKAKQTSDVHEVMMNMWKKITSKPDNSSSEETDSDGKQSKPKLHDPRKASLRKIEDSSSNDVPMKTKSKLSPIIFNIPTQTNTDTIQQPSEKTKNSVKKPTPIPTSTKKGTVQKVRHISGVHPKCKDYWQYTVESITFVNLHIKPIADPALKDFVTEIKRYFKDPRMEMKKGLIPRNICPNTGLVVKPKSRCILEKKCQNSKQPTRTVSEDSVHLQASEQSEQIKSTFQNEVQKPNSQRSKSLEIKSENLPLISSEKENFIRKSISSDDKEMTNSIVPCTIEADSQEKSKPMCKKYLSFDDKAQTLIPCGTKRKAENNANQTAKISKQEVASNNNDNSLREELLKYALDSKSVPTSKSENIVLPAFKPVRHEASVNNTTVHTYLTSSFNDSDTSSYRIMLVDNSKKNTEDSVQTKDICDQKAVEKPEIKPGTSSDHGKPNPGSTLLSPCVNISSEISIPLVVHQGKDPLLSTNKADTLSSINTPAETYPLKPVIVNTETTTSDVTPHTSSVFHDSTSSVTASELSFFNGIDSKVGTSNKCSSDSEKNTNNSSDITSTQTKTETSCGSDKEEGELISSDESVIFVGETKHHSMKKMKRKRHVLDSWENKELSLVDSIAEIRNEKHKNKVTKQRCVVDRELPSKKSRKIEHIFEEKKNKMSDKMRDILNNCPGTLNSSAIKELKETSSTPQSVSESDRKTTTESENETICKTRSKPDNFNDTCFPSENKYTVKDQKTVQTTVCKEMIEDHNQVVGLISLPNELSHFDDRKIELQSSYYSDLTIHSTDSGMLSSRKDLSEIEKSSLLREDRGKGIERHYEFGELPSLFSQKRSDSHYEENTYPCEPVDQLGVLSPGRFACPIQQRLSPLSDITLSGHEMQPQLGLQHPSVNLQPQLETPNILNVNTCKSIFIRNETPMFTNYNFNFGPVHHHNYLLQQLNPVFRHQMYPQENDSPVQHRNIHINPAMMQPRGSHNPNLVLMQQGTRHGPFITRPSLASTPSSSRSVSPTSPDFFNYSHRLVSDRDPMLSDSIQHMAPDDSPKTLEPRRPMVEDLVGQDSMMSQKQRVYIKDVMTSPNLSVEAVLKKREQDLLIPQNLQKKSKVSIPPLNSESLYLNESMKTKLCELTKKTHNRFSDVVSEASTSSNCEESRNITPARPASQEIYRPIYPKPFSSVNCVIMLEDYFILHRSLDVLEALFLQLSHAVQGWKVFIHSGVISVIEKRSKCGIFDAMTVEAMQRFALVEKYKLRGLIVLVNTCKCTPSQSLLEEKAVCLKQIQSVLYPHSAHTVLITDFVNNMQQMNNGLIISSLDPFYKRYCSR